MLTFRNELRIFLGHPGEMRWIDGTVINPTPVAQMLPGIWLLYLNYPLILMLVQVVSISFGRKVSIRSRKIVFVLLVILQVGGSIAIPHHGGEDMIFPWLLGIPVIVLLAIAFWNGVPTLPLKPNAEPIVEALKSIN